MFDMFTVEMWFEQSLCQGWLALRVAMKKNTIFF